MGCGNQEYDDAMDHGMKAVEDEQFKDALEYFEEALNEKPDDEEATTAIEQIELINKSVEKLIDEEMSEAISLLEKATQKEQGPEVITNTAKEMLDDIENMDKQLHNIDALINEKDFEKAHELMDNSIVENDGKVYMMSFEKQLTSLEDNIKVEELFAYIEGHSNNVNNDMEICQVTEDDIMCTLMTVGVYSYEETESIKLESDDTLELEIADGTNLFISNISEDSYDMHDRTFNKTTAENIVTRVEYAQSIEEIFDRETFEYILETGIGQHELFKSDEQTEENAQSEESTQASFDGYSDEEVEYARVWLDYVNGPNPPQLTVTFDKEGDFISPYAEYDNLVYPEDVTVLLGEYGADGMVTYSSNGDGTINVYDVPSHWHQQSDEAFNEAAEEVLETVKKKEVPTGNDEQVLSILENMIIDESIE